jgi:hypothetical protein
MTLNKLLLIAILPVPLGAQHTAVYINSPGWQGAQLGFVTKVEPPGDDREALQGGVLGNVERPHRVIFDERHRRYFGYDLRLEPLADGKTLQLRIEPLTLSRAQAEENGIGAGWKLLVPAKYPAVPPLRMGETLALDLLVNPATGQKIVDYLTLRRSRFDVVAASVPPRDFKITDVELTLDRPRLFVNGKMVEASSKLDAGVSGGTVWFYLPGRGKFAISLFPVPGLFWKSGTVAANVMTFRAQSSDYRVECRSPIAPGSELYNIYLHHEETWQPKGVEATMQFFIGGNRQTDFVVRQ